MAGLLADRTETEKRLMDLQNRVTVMEEYGAVVTRLSDLDDVRYQIGECRDICAKLIHLLFGSRECFDGLVEECGEEFKGFVNTPLPE
jgi:hypothetical protein